MSARILVAYASVRGSTAEIAKAVGEKLKSAGHSVDVREIVTVSSIIDYDAVVIGGPLYMGKLAGGIGRFVEKNRDALAKVPVAAFAVGIAPVSKNPGDLESAMKMLRTGLGPIEPVAATVFAGVVDPAKLSFVQRWMIKKVKTPVGDFRDWDVIARWARELPGKMGM
ncbi:MAG: flavodoxin [Methanoregulaceae archaeon]|nr:flavodoxin [Methanoregulaceae archaeon]